MSSKFPQIAVGLNSDSLATFGSWMLRLKEIFHDSGVKHTKSIGSAKMEHHPKIAEVQNRQFNPPSACFQVPTSCWPSTRSKLSANLWRPCDTLCASCKTSTVRKTYRRTYVFKLGSKNVQESCVSNMHENSS